MKLVVEQSIGGQKLHYKGGEIISPPFFNVHAQLIIRTAYGNTILMNDKTGDFLFNKDLPEVTNTPYTGEELIYVTLLGKAKEILDQAFGENQEIYQNIHMHFKTAGDAYLILPREPLEPAVAVGVLLLNDKVDLFNEPKGYSFKPILELENDITNNREYSEYFKIVKE
jgi:hypothetical protein